MKKVSMTIATMLVTGVGFGQTATAVTNVSDFGMAGWESTDTRVEGANATTQAQIDSRIQFVQGPAGADGGALNLIAPATSDKATLALVDTNGLGGLAGLTAEYRWYKDSPSGAAAPGFKIGLQTADFGTTGSSSRIGENDWDKVLIYEPYDNPSGGNPPTGQWITQTLDAETGTWWMFDRTTLTTVNAPHNSLTLAEWMDDEEWGTLLTGATIVDIQLGVGSGNADVDSYVDYLSVSFDGGVMSTTYNFIPEPTSLTLLGIGGMMMLRRRR
ncbi:PEP-CTERM sorting domain-containing protein [Phycisphaerales bacterium AB-hyl4]|uniref:PEP-CTERM sorting domain-containing protein n=1 Tax=Natronomicrosphaera hydrolytica TaxID=3242702 RepID=A0ABV4U5S4_9BACT